MRRAEIGPYRILRLVKRGGGGSVYSAHDQRLNRRVALKLMRMPRDRSQRELVIAEAHRLASLNHRAIVQIFDVVETRAHLALVMEYVPGTDLGALLSRLNLRWPIGLQLSLDLCAALAACHQSGIVHRDLKPANVLLNPQGRVKLTDFGISLALRESGLRETTLEPVVPGSLLAMSPEHASGAPVDERSDLFSLGLMLYRLLSGKHPFADADNELVLLQQVTHGSHRPLVERVPDLPMGVSAVVDTLLEKDPRQRPASAQAVRQQILTILRDLPLSRTNVLGEIVAGRSREEDEVETELELPENFSRGVRSRLLPAEEWGPWALNMDGVLSRILLAIGGLCLLLLVVFGLSRIGLGGSRAVLINPPLVLGASAGNPLPDGDLLRAWLSQAVAEIGDLQLGTANNADRLSLQVNCNPYLCGLLLTRTGPGGNRVDYRTLLPDAPEPAWRALLDESLRSVYED